MELKQGVMGLYASWLDNSEFLQIALVMMSPMSIGTNDSVAISRFTGVPLPTVQELKARFLANGSWEDDALTIDSADPTRWGIDLTINVLVTAGLVERRQPANAGISSPAAAPEAGIAAPRDVAGSQKEPLAAAEVINPMEDK